MLDSSCPTVVSLEAPQWLNLVQVKQRSLATIMSWTISNIAAAAAMYTTLLYAHILKHL